MLILWRRSGQSVVIGEGIEIQILESGANRVKLGIAAPTSVQVFRKEVQATREHNIEAAASADHVTLEKLFRMARSKASATRGRDSRQIFDSASSSVRDKNDEKR